MSFVRILGVRFLDADASVAIAKLRAGALMVVPSGPGLATLPRDKLYREALQAADFAIVDSAYLAWLWFLHTGQRLHRVSGLSFMRKFVQEPTARVRGASLLVNPSLEDARVSVSWLRRQGWDIGADDCYVAPQYSASVQDPALVELLRARRPRYVVLCIGGGTQEPLGHYLKRNLDYTPAIICTGAALAFLTGQQVKIPAWADLAGLGWLARSLSDPRRFVPRYWAAIGLSSLVFRHREDMPPFQSCDP